MRAVRPSGLVSSYRYSTAPPGDGAANRATLPVRSASSAAAADNSSTSSNFSCRSDLASSGVTAAILSTSGGRLRNASPRPAARRIGKMNTQNIASGSRQNSRNRTRVSCASGWSDHRVLLIAQVPSRQNDEDVLQAGGMRAQFGERNALPVEFVQQRGHGPVQFGHLHPYAAVLRADLAHTLDPAERGKIQRPRRAAGRKLHQLLHPYGRDQFTR